MKPLVDESYQLLAARYVRKQTKQLSGQLDGVRTGEDIEFIHRARVASRRLRAALRMFRDCFRPGDVKTWRKAMRRLTTRLGDARDKDVQIEFVCDVLCNLEQRDCYPGIARLLVTLEHRRESLQSKVVGAVDRLQASGVLEEMHSAAKTLLADLETPATGVASEHVFALAEEHIASKLDELMAYRSGLEDPQEQEQHHAMRIAAKRLRYTMEICKPAYDGRLDEFIGAAKETQSFLGEIHDCDVWVEHLKALLEKEEARIVAAFGHAGPLARLQVGIDYLREERRKQRQQVFQELVSYWQGLEQRGLWESLAQTVRSRDGQSSRPELPANVSGRKVEHKLATHWHKLKQSEPGDDSSANEPSPGEKAAEIERAGDHPGRTAGELEVGQ